MLTRISILLLLLTAAHLPGQGWLLPEEEEYPLETYWGVRYAQVPDTLVRIHHARGGPTPGRTFPDPDDFAPMPDRLDLRGEESIWARLAVQNAGDSSQSYLFELDTAFRDWRVIDVYTVDGDSLRQHEVTGNEVRPAEKSIRDRRNLLELTVEPGGVRELTIRFTPYGDLKRATLAIRLLDRSSMQDFRGFSLTTLNSSSLDSRYLIETFRVDHSLEFVIDSTEGFSFQRIREEWDTHARFVRRADYYASRKYVVWCRLKLINRDRLPRNYYFSTGADEPIIEVFLPVYNGGYRRVVTGKQVPLKEKPVSSPLNYVDYTLSASDTAYIYLKYHPLRHNKGFLYNIFDAGITFADPNAVLHITRLSALWKGAISGILIFQFLYFLLRSIIIKDTLELYFAAIVLGFSLVFVYLENFGNTFYAYQLFFEDSDVVLFLSFSFLSVGLFAFTNKYLELRSRMPLIYRVQSVMLAIILIMQIGAFVEGRLNWSQFADYHAYFPFFQQFLLTLVGFILIYLLASLIGYFRGVPYALTYFIAFSPFLLITLVNAYQIIQEGDSPVFRINLFYLGFIATSVLFAIIGAKRHNEMRQRDVEAANLVKLNEAKSEFYSNITHEFRTPLTVIMGMANLIDGHTKERDLIRKNGQDVLNLVQQLQDMARAQTEGLNLQLIEDDILLYLEYLVESFHFLAEDKQITLAFHHQQKEIVLAFDRQKVRFVLNNLVGNALKFTPRHGRVTVTARLQDRNFVLSVSDTGIGLSPTEAERVFDRYYQVQPGAPGGGIGDGIGLSLVKELAEGLGGGIRVESAPEAGSTFTVHLPVRQLAETDTSGQVVESSRESPPLIFSDAPTALIVDDNQDVQYYIRRVLSPRYTILTAGDGQAGFDLAVAHIPDIIVSDLMMPVLDGNALLEMLKRDPRTNHIPVIILTAKTGRTEKIKGLATGADAYLAKPFDEGELLVRIDKLIERQQVLQRSFGASRAGEKASPPLDPFLEESLGLLEDRFAEETFGVRQFVDALPLSRMQIHRKLKALTGHSTSQFINHFRLEKAKELLDRAGLNVSETAYACGFNDPGYFSKLFSKKYGVSPLEYRHRMSSTQ